MSRLTVAVTTLLFLGTSGLYTLGAWEHNAIRDHNPQNLVQIDASQPMAAPEMGFLHLGGKSVTRHDLEINSRYLTLDGKSLFPIMGEFQFSRYPPQEWEDEILKMKSGGINVIATYIFWIHHEEIEGQFDWKGQRDLRRFVELCQKHGLYVFLRIGPWDHGEARNGGFPDWLLKNPNLRTNDPSYLAHVFHFDREIAAQVKGLLWKDGGPVIGAQLENEYALHGPGEGAEHILKLKELAIAAGIEVPIYTVTGWPSLDFPPHEVIPVSGGYPDGFWFGSVINLAPSVNYLFNFNRKLGDMGATVPSEDPTGKVDLRHDPYFAAEEAGGMEASYHRRPLISADDIAALTLTGFGSGLNLYGYYLFHGGANPQGKLTSLQESQATGYPNDLPLVNYDFQAPLGEYGQVRESYRKVKPLHLFANAFGSELAPMQAVAPEQVPSGPADITVPRVAARVQGDRAFLFINNYVRQLPMPKRIGFQVNLKLPGHAILVPAQPVTVPANSYFFWPVNLPMAGTRLRYSTAQLLTRLDTPDNPTFVFFTIPGIVPEFSLDPGGVQTVQGDGAIVTRREDSIQIRVSSPSTLIAVRSKDGARIQILLLTQADAESAVVAHLDDGDHLLLASADVFLDGSQLHLRSKDNTALRFRAFPGLDVISMKGKMNVATRGLWTQVTFDQPKVAVPWTWKKTKDAKSVPPVTLGPYFDWRHGSVAQAPSETAFNSAAEWAAEVPAPLPPGISNLWLNIDYTGDIARLYIDNSLVDDDFFHGTTWQIGLRRFLHATPDSPIRVKILPLRADAPIYLDPTVRSALPAHGQVASIAHVSLEPEYEAVVDLSATLDRNATSQVYLGQNRK